MGLLVISSSLFLFILLYVDELEMLLHVLLYSVNNWCPYGKVVKIVLNSLFCLSFFWTFHLDILPKIIKLFENLKK